MVGIEDFVRRASELRENLMESLRADRTKVEIPTKEVLEIDLALALLTTHLEEHGDPIGADEVRSLKKRVMSCCATDGNADGRF